MVQTPASGLEHVQAAVAPAWFARALAVPYTDRQVTVSGCDVHYIEWGEVGAPGLVLVHGGGAHAHWWTFIGPQLAHQYHVVAIDLSGHGDSGRREVYGDDVWAEEILAVAADAQIDRPIVVGHSMGGIVALATAVLHRDRLAGVVTIDSHVMRVDPESMEARRAWMARKPSTYPDLETAVEHFRLTPPQPCDNHFIMDYVARRSLSLVEGRWCWKFDPLVFQRTRQWAIGDHLDQLRCRVAVIYGELSQVVSNTEDLDQLLHGRAAFVEITDARHHVPLDQPIALVAAIRAVVAGWRHSSPEPPMEDETFPG
jgi:pimeloyl-ACP methyl ester carboxylesterase